MGAETCSQRVTMEAGPASVQNAFWYLGTLRAGSKVFCS